MGSDWEAIQNELDAVLTKHGVDPASIRLGASCGRGWHPLIDNLLAQLVSMGWDKQVVQIKEKFGGLRFYVGEATDEMREAIRAAESASFKTCERCGAAGTPQSTAWIKTCCDACAAKDDPI